MTGILRSIKEISALVADCGCPGTAIAGAKQSGAVRLARFHEMMNVILRAIGGKVPDNLFRQALDILNAKNGDMTEEEREVINTALLGVTCFLPRIEPEYDEMPISEGLEEMAKIVEGGK